MRKILIILMTALGILALVFSHDIAQKNPETIFLTEKSLDEYRLFQKDILEKHSLVIKKNTTSKEEFYRQMQKIEELCVDDCEIITHKKLQKNEQKLDDPDDLMKLETSDYVAAIVMDNNDELIKKILHYANSTTYWNVDTSFAGIPYTNFLLDKYSLTIQEKLFPTMFVMGFLISLFFIGNFKHAMVVYLPCLFSAGFSLSVLKIFFGTMNMVTSIIPLVIFTVALSLSFHLFFSLKELKNLKVVFKVKWAPIFLMMFTTYIGFFSLGWAEISVIRDFGIVSAQLVLLATTFIFLWYFCWEKFLIFVIKKERGFINPVLFSRSLPKWGIAILGVGGLLSVILVPSKLEIITDATAYFPAQTQIREKILAVTSSVSGMPIMEVAIDLGHDFETNDINKMHLLEKDLLSQSWGRTYKVVSNNTLVSKVNQQYSGEKALPQAIDSYLLLRGQLPSSLQESYPVEKKYRMTFLGRPINVDQYMQDLAVVKAVLNRHGVNYKVNGIHHNLMVSQNAMISVLVESFLSSGVVIFLFAVFFLKSVKNIFIFIFVSLLPICLTFGAMYLMGFSINIATVMTFSISLGMVGDSSFHIIYAKKVRFNSFEEYSKGVLVPIIGSGLLLVLCFAMFSLNTFMPIRQFGSILATIMLLGTFVDLYILPTLIYGSNEHQKAYEIQD